MKFEDALKRLETVVERLERGELSLDASLKAFEEGIKLSRFLTGKLEEAEGKVEILIRDSKGEIRQEDFSREAEDSPEEESGLEEGE